MPSLIGEALREQKRNAHIENVKEKAESLFNEAFITPYQIQSTTDFIQCWNLFEAGLLKTFGQQKDYRLAFKCGETQLRKLKSQHKWPYSPPSTIVTNRPEKQTRQPNWLKTAWNLYDQYEQWRQTRNRDTHDIALRYQSIILSLIFESGQQSAGVVKAFSKLLSIGDDLNLISFSCYTYLPLFIENNQLNTNTSHNGERVTEYQCYLSIHTLGQLKLWRDTVKNEQIKQEWKAPDNSKEIYRRITEGFSISDLKLTGLSALCSCAGFWYEKKMNTMVSQALLDVRNGRTATYSLPESNLIQVLRPTINIPEDVSFYHFGQDLKLPSRSFTSNSLFASGLPVSAFLSVLKKAFKKENGLKLSPTALRTSLDSLINDYDLEAWQECFVHWLKIKLDNCQPSTVNNYQCTLIKDWIYMNTECSLNKHVMTDDLAEIYQHQINRHSTRKSKHHFTARLKDLHAYAVVSLGLPALEEDFFHCDATRKHTRAGIIDEPLFKSLLSHISLLKDLNDSDKLALQSLCITSYRCGLRLVELYKLQMGNVSECEEVWLDIRPNALGDNKTACGLRTVFLMPLLLADEKEIVKRYLQHKRTVATMKSDPLFTMGDDTKQPFNKAAVSNYVGQMLKVTSELKHLVFHHLRHSCLSRLQIMLESESPQRLLPHAYPYDKEQTKHIKKLLFKSTYQQGYAEIAAFAGHESPSMTFSHYFHFSDLLAAPHRDLYLQKIDMNEALNTGVFTHHRYNEMHSKHSEVKMGHGFEYLIKQLNITPIKFSDEQYTQQSVSLITDTKPIITFDTCRKVLSAIEQGKEVNELVFKYRLDSDTIEKWLQNVEYIKSLRPDNDGGANNSRFFPSNRQHTLTPGVLTRVEKKYITIFNQKLRDHYPTHKQEFTTQMHYYLHHVCVSRAGIRFTSPTVLTNFITAFSFAIPKSHWRAVTDNMISSTQKKEWDKVLKGITINKNCDGTSAGRSGLGSVSLELKDPSEQSRIEKGAVRKYSTSLLKTLMFYAFVMIGNAKSDDDDLLHSDE